MKIQIGREGGGDAFIVFAVFTCERVGRDGLSQKHSPQKIKERRLWREREIYLELFYCLAKRWGVTGPL